MDTFYNYVLQVGANTGGPTLGFHGDADRFGSEAPMGDSIDIYCVGGRGRFDAALAVDKQLHLFSLSIANAADMAEKVVRTCRSSGKRLGELTIVDHGTPLGQWMGSDWVDLTSLPSFQNHLQKH